VQLFVLISCAIIFIYGSLQKTPNLIILFSDLRILDNTYLFDVRNVYQIRPERISLIIVMSMTAVAVAEAVAVALPVLLNFTLNSFVIIIVVNFVFVSFFILVVPINF
jgi:hypothetical protein